MSAPDTPFPAFAFQVEFSRPGGGDVPICTGGFSECSGLEATMEPKVIRGGGQNYGASQRAGQVSFATVILKRGMTSNRDLWSWFSHVNQAGKSALRLNVTITVLAPPTSAPSGGLKLEFAGGAIGLQIGGSSGTAGKPSFVSICPVPFR